MKGIFNVLAFIIIGLFAQLNLQSQVAIFPHLEDFQNENLCPTGCAANCNLKGTWQNAPSGFDLDFVSDIITSPSGGTGPTYDHTLGNSNGFYVYRESSCNTVGYPNKTSALISPYYDFRGLSGNIFFEIWYHMYGVHMGVARVDIDTTQGSGSWINNITPSWTDHLNSWQNRIVDLSAFINHDSVRIRIRYTSGLNYAGDIAFDDLRVYQPQAFDVGVVAIPGFVDGCAKTNAEDIIIEVRNFGAQTLQMGDSIPACYQLGADPPVCETFVLLDTLGIGESVQFTFSQTVDVSLVKAYSLSAWTTAPADIITANDESEINFETTIVINEFPYSQGFENGKGSWESSGENSSWAWGKPNKTFINGAGGGHRSWVNGWLNGTYNNAEQSYVYSPCFDFTNLCRPEIEFKCAWGTEFSWDGAVLQYSTNDGGNWFRVGTFGNGNNWFTDNTINSNPGGQPQGWSGDTSNVGSAGWVIAKNYLFAIAGKPAVRFRFAFGSDNSFTDEGFAFDDIVIYEGVYLGEDVAICVPGSHVLEADSFIGDHFTWSTGDTTASITVTTPGVYWVSKTNDFLTTCFVADTIEVIGITGGYTVALGADTTACGSHVIDGSDVPGATYAWSNGDSVRYATVDMSGTYWVDVTTPCGIVRSDTIAVTIIPAPNVNLGGDTTLCGGLWLDAGVGMASYLWSNGDTVQNVFGDQTGIYWAEVTLGNGCLDRDSIELIVDSLPSLAATMDTTICTGDTVCISANGSASNTYLWSTGSTLETICVTQEDEYIITATAGNGCKKKDTVNVFIPALPNASIGYDTSGCPFVAFFDNSTGGARSNWLWDFGDGFTDTLQNPIHDYSVGGTGIYNVTLIAGNTCGSDTTIEVVIVACPIGFGEALSGQIRIYPNPNQGSFNITLTNDISGQGQLRIFSTLGKLIDQSQNIFIQGKASEKISLDGLSDGIYYLNLQIGERIFLGKIIVR